MLIWTCAVYSFSPNQGRRRVFKSGPAEEPIECWRHERGEGTRGGIIPPLVREGGGGGGGLGGAPQRLFLILSASTCVFNVFFLCLGPDFSRFGHDPLLEKIFLVAFFRQSRLFSSACFIDIISSMSPLDLAKYF